MQEKIFRKLEEQVREFSPRLVAVWDENAAQELAQKIQDTDTKVVAGMDGLLELAAMPDTEILVTAIVGMLGIRPTIEAIRAGKDIALANKETLVTAGHLIIPMAKEYGVKILPVDSEHSAVFQSLNGEHKEEVHKLLITASGGPFRGKTRKDLESVTLEDTLKHPNWVMGQKITVDSATLVNKGLEVMEARWLFDVSLDQIQVVVQPQSVIHSMVEFKDGGIIAQLGTPDMRLPIQYALYYPHRRYLNGDRLDFAKLGQITFEEPDMDTFLGLPMAIQAAKAGGSMPTVFNAANELAVSKFLHKKIRFLDIYDIIGQSMERHKVIENPGLEEILETESDTYQWIESRCRLKILIAIIIFSAIILFHEFGHFLFAKLNGISVTEFSLGMGPRLWSFQKGETRYSLKLLPLGGSCAMVGEDTAEEEIPGSFNAASVWGRISVVAAGPIFNFILAFVLAVIIVGFVGYDPAEVLEVDKNSAAAEAGLQNGDIITRI